MQMEKKLKKLYNGVLLKEYVEPSELGDKHSQKVFPSSNPRSLSDQNALNLFHMDLQRSERYVCINLQ